MSSAGFSDFFHTPHFSGCHQALLCSDFLDTRPIFFQEILKDYCRFSLPYPATNLRKIYWNFLSFRFQSLASLTKVGQWISKVLGGWSDRWHVETWHNCIIFFPVKTRLNITKVHTEVHTDSTDSKGISLEWSSAVIEMSVICRLHLLDKLANQSIFYLLTSTR